jgi:hypothetical protein
MKQGILLAAAVFAFAIPLTARAQEQAATKEDIQEVKDALQGVSESAAEYRGYVDALRKIKISGYIQSQWRLADVDLFPSTPSGVYPVINYPIGNFAGGAFPSATKNMFQVRRGRLKVVYDNVLTQFVLQVDAIQTGFTTKDAYLMVTEPWTKSFGLQMGIFNRPFGYEIPYSSSNRETPERARIYQTLFPGERELGGEIFIAPPTGPLSFMRLDLGVFNGSGPTANEFDNYKDIIGHVSAQIPLDGIGAALDLGVSGYFGGVRNNTKNLYTMGTLPNGSQGYVLDSSATNLGAGVQRTYYGVDAQFYIDIPMIGGAILRGEYIFGKQPNTSSTSTSPSAQPATALYQREVSGYLIYYIQNIGNHEQLVVKYDAYDPNTKVGAGDFTSSNTSGATGLTSTDLQYTTLGLGFVHHWDDNVKFMFYYEMVHNEKLSGITDVKSSLYQYADDARDNVFTFRVQYKF